jgi:hypothetical protein
MAAANVVGWGRPFNAAPIRCPVSATAEAGGIEAPGNARLGNDYLEMTGTNSHAGASH